ncbi:MAG: type II toxin-antitoxin system VapC family toxin [Acetobacteraceae bacterium]|nr:type II toxin-antitoxin system VapC family toxin [Acetobacteraceae bacterium]
MAPARGWLIDTNVVSELRKGTRCAPAVRAWSERVPRIACFISRVSLAEIRFGIERAADPAFRAELEAWVQDGVLPWFGPRVIEVDERVLVDWRHLDAEGRKTRYTFANPDALIAACARVHQLGVATRNVQDFVRAGVRILNPWDEAA